MVLRKILLIGFCAVFLFSCKKEEQSCHDGIFSPNYEEDTDCGGVCPPCDFTPPELPSFLEAEVQGDYIGFSTFGVSKNENFNLFFSNDSVEVALNLGVVDTIESYSILQQGSTSIYKYHHFSELVEGICLISEIDIEKQYISGFFNATFASGNGFDTLKIRGGEFNKVKWQ